jgi:L-rhamnose-H+ transport protein
MISSTPAGLALTVLAGFMAGNCMLPSKFLRGWGWENMWSIFSVVSLVILPWTLAFLLVDHLGAVYRTVHPLQLIVPVVFGMCWGVAQVLFGLSVERLGLGLAYAIIVGMGAALGTLVPLFVAQRNALGRNTPLFVLTGISLMVVGIAFTTWAGRLRERRVQPGDSSHLRTRYRAAVLLAVLCGFLAPMLNYSFAFGQDIAQRSIALGNSPLHAAYAVWPISLMGGILPQRRILRLSADPPPKLARVHQTASRFTVVIRDGRIVDGCLCRLWHECRVSWKPGNLHRMGTVSDLYDHDRDPVRHAYGRMEERSWKV